MMANLGDVLYRRNEKSGSDSETTNDSEDIWDDEALITCYDKALKVAQEQVAKRLAMSTNTRAGADLREDDDKSQFKVPKDSNVTSAKNKSKKKSKKKHSSTTLLNANNSHVINELVWEVGSKCRATYSEDGIDYEATIEHILDQDNCIVTFVGYENQDVVPLSALEPSWGKPQRVLQTQQANADVKPDENDVSDNEKTLDQCRSNIPPFYSAVSGSDAHDNTPVTKSSKKKKSIRYDPSVKQGAVPSLPSFQFPPFSPSLDLNNMPPAPPMPFLSNCNGSSPREDQALSSMLISWYMSGYYTGLYQGQKNSQSWT